jgi:hypothetical protein
VPKVKVSTITGIKIDHAAGSSRIFLVPELLFMATLLSMQSEEKFNHPQKYFHLSEKQEIHLFIIL